MAVGIGNLNVLLSADTATFASDLGRAAYIADQNARKIEGAFASVRNVLGTLGVGFSIAGIVDFVKGGIEAENMLWDLSQRTGATVETLSALHLVAKQSGADLDQVASGVQKMARAMLDASTGTGKSGAVFQALGVSLKNTNGELRDSESVLIEVAQKLAAMENGTQRVAYAQEIFGKAGANLVPFLMQLAENGRLVANVTTAQAKAADEFGDNLDRLKDGSRQLSISLANELLPSLNNVVTAMLNAKAAGSGFWGSLAAGIQTLITGTDLHKANVEFSQLTDQLMTLEAQRDRAAASGAAAGSLASMDAGIAKIRDRLKVLQGFRDQLEKENAKPEIPKTKTALPAGTEATQKQITFEELLARAAMKRIQVQEDAERAGAEAADKAAQDTLEIEARASQKRIQFSEEAEAAAERQRDKLKDLADGWARVLDPAKEYRDLIYQVDEAEAAGLVSAQDAVDLREKFSKQAQDAALAMDGLNKKTKEGDDIARQLGLTFSSSFEEAIAGGKSLRDVLQGLALDVAKIFFRKSVTEPFASSVSSLVSGGGIGAAFSKLLNFGGSETAAVPAAPVSDSFANYGSYATGGSFTVGGSGGTDSQLVGFRATPGEHVTIGGSGHGGGVTINMPLNISVGVAQTVRAEIMALMPRIQSATVNAVAAARSRSTGFQGVFGS